MSQASEIVTYEKALEIAKIVLAERVKRGDQFADPDQVVEDAAKAMAAASTTIAACDAAEEVFVKGRTDQQ
ncbi:hypothetical protein ACRAVF_19300 [Bradyrhizobium oligotrophicum S58]